jgi:hypothetical protein
MSCSEPWTSSGRVRRAVVSEPRPPGHATRDGGRETGPQRETGAARDGARRGALPAPLGAGGPPERMLPCPFPASSAVAMQRRWQVGSRQTLERAGFRPRHRPHVGGAPSEASCGLPASCSAGPRGVPWREKMPRHTRARGVGEPGPRSSKITRNSASFPTTSAGAGGLRPSVRIVLDSEGCQSYQCPSLGTCASVFPQSGMSESARSCVRFGSAGHRASMASCRSISRRVCFIPAGSAKADLRSQLPVKLTRRARPADLCRPFLLDDASAGHGLPSSQRSSLE